MIALLPIVFIRREICLSKLDEISKLTDEEVLEVITSEAKKRKDSIEQFTAGDRPEMAEQEKKELEMIQKYLPEEMREEEVKKIVEKVISEMGEVLPSQFGQVMGKVMAESKGQADGTVVSKLVKETLNK